MKESHEFMYNAACCYIESGSLDAAQQCLEAAANICRESMKRDGASEQEIQDELAVIQAQQAYIMQRRGKEKEAMEQYEEILKHNVSDSTVVAVCSNNIVAIRKEHDRFNSLHKLTHLGTDQVQEKLSFSQKKSIYFNRCVLYLQMSKLQECRDLLKTFSTDFPDSEYIPLLNAALLVREKHWEDGERILTDFIAKKRGQDCVRVQLSLAQIQLAHRGDYAAVIATLKSIDALKNTPAMISALAKLLEKSGDVEGALRALDEAAAKISAGADESAIQMLKKTVDFKLKNRRHREAALALEKILKSNPGDLEALPKLVIAYAAFDADQAEKYAKRLPQQQAKAATTIDVDKLENIAPRQTYKKTVVATTDDEKAATDAAVVKNKKKTKKKKKNPPAKKADFSRPPDPERWLPKRERSYYKGPRRRGQKNTGGRSLGAQGSTSVSDAHSQAVRGTPLAKAKDEEPVTAPTPAAAPAKQPPPRAAPKKAGRKKR
jgi:signal recognition particle subunit SRP72